MDVRKANALLTVSNSEKVKDDIEVETVAAALNVDTVGDAIQEIQLNTGTAGFT